MLRLMARGLGNRATEEASGCRRRIYKVREGCREPDLCLRVRSSARTGRMEEMGLAPAAITLAAARGLNSSL